MSFSDMLLAVLLGIAIYTDMKEKVIPDTVPVGLVTYFLLAKMGGIEFTDAKTAVYGLLIGWSLTFVFSLLGLMGYGDVKLMAALGTWLGFRIFDVFLLSFIVGVFFAFFYYAKYRDRKLQIPFGPSIAIAALIIWFSGQTIFDLFAI